MLVPSKQRDMEISKYTQSYRKIQFSTTGLLASVRELARPHAVTSCSVQVLRPVLGSHAPLPHSSKLVVSRCLAMGTLWLEDTR